MILYCPRCGLRVKFSLVFVYEWRWAYADLRGHRWEVLQCDRCGHRVRERVT